MTVSKVLWVALVALGLGLLACSTGLAAVTTTGDISDGGTTSSDFYVGYFGVGTLGINAGSTLTRFSAYIGNNSSSTGTATVTGVGSTWPNNGYLYVGRYGSGTLNVQAGGQVSNGYNGILGGYSGSTGTATITGTGSMWTNKSTLYIGDYGNGTLNVQAGGQVSCNSYSYLGYDSSSAGTATITGAGSTWTNSGSLYIGKNGSGKLMVADGGLVTTGTL